MAKKAHRIKNEIKAEIINKIKREGLSVNDASEHYGVSTKTIYGWLGTRASNTLSVLEHNRLKRENEQLKHSLIRLN
ncbi:MAG: helix-turn-helix domain-containing protein [Candidatus Paceibacteria bacterium]